MGLSNIRYFQWRGLHSHTGRDEMNFANAIAKVRFASAKPQRVILAKNSHLTAELLCLEPGQEMKITSGQWNYYVITATGSFSSNEQVEDVPTGQFAASDPGETHTLANNTEQRLIILAVGTEK